ncbi:hypothetical protein Landi51_12371 [Colletotrichum acutatum]
MPEEGSLRRALGGWPVTSLAAERGRSNTPTSTSFRHKFAAEGSRPPTPPPRFNGRWDLQLPSDLFWGNHLRFAPRLRGCLINEKCATLISFSFGEFDGTSPFPNHFDTSFSSSHFDGKIQQSLSLPPNHFHLRQPPTAYQHFLQSDLHSNPSSADLTAPFLVNATAIPPSASSTASISLSHFDSNTSYSQLDGKSPEPIPRAVETAVHYRQQVAQRTYTFLGFRLGEKRTCSGRSQTDRKLFFNHSDILRVGTEE